ncbi:cupin domain-containing protein [Georgenia yuyongxinii]|uniref:Cupin domain-containing protein n=2 Tax=Georgenia yuyongxinii TaxID=2589797 RepID=A0A552WQR8_9MICO|nr:cupin domain-containing protein [Georgenia yuyongxinii]
MLPMPHAAVAPEQDRTGGTTTATVPLDGVDGLDVGVWEMSAGTMTDVEADELFVVLAGRATVEILPVNGFTAAVATLRPGTVMRLAAGMHTVWTVTEPLRKVYVAR